MMQVKRKPPATPKQAVRCCAPIDSLLDPEFFRAFSDPTRALLVSCIAKCGRPCSVGEIAECCSVDTSVVSRHLALLSRAGVLEASKHGRTVHYSVRYGAVSKAFRSMAKAFDECGPKGGSNGCGCC